MLVLRPVISSTIIAVGHDGYDLYVLFRSQKLYCYQAVPADLFDQLRLSSSKGSYLNSDIKPHFSFRVSQDPYRIQTQFSIRDLLPGPSFGF